jgi:hypothetical protein
MRKIIITLLFAMLTSNVSFAQKDIFYQGGLSFNKNNAKWEYAGTEDETVPFQITGKRTVGLHGSYNFYINIWNTHNIPEIEQRFENWIEEKHSKLIEEAQSRKKYKLQEISNVGDINISSIKSKYFAHKYKDDGWTKHDRYYSFFKDGYYVHITVWANGNLKVLNQEIDKTLDSFRFEPEN